MSVSLKITNIDAIVQRFKLATTARPLVSVGITIQGKAAAYGLVWEWGRVGINPGPKTLWGVNPDGDVRVMTKTAPSGFIHIHKADARRLVKQEMARIKWAQIKITNLPAAVERALTRAAYQLAELIAASAPIDSGDLRSEIRVMSLDDQQPRVVQGMTTRAQIRSRVKK